MKNILSQQEIKEFHDLYKEYYIGKYTINPDGSIDVDGDVYLSRKGLTSLPLRFNKVSGGFYCRFNKLTSLEHCPKEIGGHFNCNDNRLTSLEFSPKEVGGHFNCNSNILTSLEFSPKEVGGYFACNSNNLPEHFKELYTELSDEEIKILLKYQDDLRIWDDGYEQEVAQDLFDDIKDGLL